MKLARITTIAGMAIVLGASCFAGYNHIASGVATRAADEILTAAISDLHTRDLTHVLGAVKVDGIQVQQWPTEISESWGFDDLNNGFDEAAGFRSAGEA